MRNSILIVSLPLFSLVTGCLAVEDQDLEDGVDESFDSAGKGDGAALTEGSPEALGVLAAANRATLSELDDDAAISSRTAKNIIQRRAGTDKIVGTADDKPFKTLAELDAVPYVGPVALEQLLAYARGRDWVSVPGLVPTCGGAPRLPSTGALAFTAATKSTFVRDCDAFGACTAWSGSGADVVLTLEGKNDVAPAGLMWLHELASGRNQSWDGALDNVDIFTSYASGYPGGGYVHLGTTGKGVGFMNASVRRKECNSYGCSSWSYQYGSFRPVTLVLGATCMSITDDDPQTNYGHQIKNVIRATW